MRLFCQKCNKLQLNEEIHLLTLSSKCKDCVDSCYSNATVDDFGISFQTLTALPLGKVTHSNVD